MRKPRRWTQEQKDAQSARLKGRAKGKPTGRAGAVEPGGEARAYILDCLDRKQPVDPDEVINRLPPGSPDARSGGALRQFISKVMEERNPGTDARVGILAR